MSESIQNAILGQFEAALAMLSHCVDTCPAEHWEERIANNTFRQVAYHALFFADYYLSPNEDTFQLRALHQHGGDERRPEVSAGLSQTETISYAAVCRQKAIDVLASETQVTLAGRSGFSPDQFREQSYTCITSDIFNTMSDNSARTCDGSIHRSRRPSHFAGLAPAGNEIREHAMKFTYACHRIGWLFIATIGTFLGSTWSSAQAVEQPDSSTLHYPIAHRGDQVDDYHGTKVADPHRWLENVDSAETRDWVKAENQLTNGYLEKLHEREAIRRRLTELWNYPKYGIPSQRGGRYFFTKNSGLQNQAVLYWIAGLDGAPQVLLDPNVLSENGTVAVSHFDVSDNGQLLAYGLSTAGSDWQEWRVRDVTTGKDLSDHLKWIKFSSVSWTPDNKGFFYSRYAEPNEATKLVDTNYYQKLYYHRIGDSQALDQLVYERPDEKEWEFSGTASEDGKCLVIEIHHGTEQKNLVFYKRLDQPDAKVVELISDFKAKYAYLGNNGSVFWFRTDLDAPRGRIISIDLERPEPANRRELVAESADVMAHAGVVGDQFIAEYLHDAHSAVKVFDLTGKLLREVELPGLGTAAGFDGRRNDSETFFSFTSFALPPTIYRYELPTGKAILFRQPQVDFHPDNYETRQVFYTSRDGTRVPMFISAKKGVKLDGDNPTLLYGYGGFNISLTPSFSVPNLVWMQLGGVFAVPSLRGGGEYGREWHEAGTKLKKQNVFDDFIAAAQWLIDNHYTSREKLAISGRSNGGLLVGACLTQRPDLFGAALPGVGVMDMLRFHKFTIGWGWTSDYGSSDNPDEFNALRGYSPLHNIKPGTQYPPTLITTGDHDDRVVPGHSFKFAAAMQAAQSGTAPILIRIETQAGHGAGKPTTKLIDEATDQLAFLVNALKMKIDGRP